MKGAVLNKGFIKSVGRPHHSLRRRFFVFSFSLFVPTYTPKWCVVSPFTLSFHLTPKTTTNTFLKPNIHCFNKNASPPSSSSHRSPLPPEPPNRLPHPYTNRRPRIHHHRHNHHPRHHRASCHRDNRCRAYCHPPPWSLGWANRRHPRLRSRRRRLAPHRRLLLCRAPKNAHYI